MFKVLVTGAKGQVGSELVKAAPNNFEVIGLASDQLDITDSLQLKAVMAKHKPHLIINAAAYTAVDKAESEIESAYNINEKGVESLALAAKEANIPLFHISTDYVFDGQSNTPYKETDLVNPHSVYGASKLAGEKVLAKNLDKHIILRTSWVFGAAGNNFVKTMLRLGKERDELFVVADQYGCPTSAKSIAEVLWQLAEKYEQEHSLPWGIYHFSNTPACTWLEFARHIFEHAANKNIIEKAATLNAISSSEYPTAAKRPKYSVLNSSKLQKIISSKPINWNQELINALNQNFI